jgi:ribulose-phosphate 3-epimerase
MTRYEILPAVLPKTSEEALQKLRVAQDCSPWFQWDVMDGKFVPNTTWYDAEKVQTWTIRSRIELHLMVRDPGRVIEAWRNVPKFKRAVWHIEAPIDHEELINKCKDMGRDVGLAISPKTSLLELTPYVEFIESVLVMGVEPGFSGQGLLPETAERIRQIRNLNKDLVVNVDGGVNAKTLLGLAKAGAKRFCMGSAIFDHAFPSDFVKGQLERLEHARESR